MSWVVLTLLLVPFVAAVSTLFFGHGAEAAELSDAAGAIATHASDKSVEVGR